MANEYLELLNLLCTFAQLIVSYCTYKSSKTPKTVKSPEITEAPDNT